MGLRYTASVSQVGLTSHLRVDSGLQGLTMGSVGEAPMPVWFLFSGEPKLHLQVLKAFDGLSGELEVHIKGATFVGWYDKNALYQRTRGWQGSAVELLAWL